jgi:hypothetical protein
MTCLFSTTTGKTSSELIDRRRKKKKCLDRVVLILQKWFEVDHPLRIYYIEWVFSKLDNTIKFRESRSVIISMYESIFDHITRVDPRLELFAGKKIIMHPFHFTITHLTRGRGYYLFKTFGMFYIQLFPDSSLTDPGRSGKNQNMWRNGVHNRNGNK